MEEEAHVYLVGGGDRGGGGGGGVGRELEGHGRGVVWDAVEVGVGGGEVGEAEEGFEGGVGAELEGELGRARGVDGGVEGLEDLRGEGGAGDGADGGGLVEGEVVFVGVG